MSVEILLQDLTDKALRTGAQQNASLNNITGLLARAKTYRFKDAEGELSPLSPRGIFFQQVWPNELITETDEFGKQEFVGQTKSLATQINQSGYFTALEARELIGNYIDFIIEENDITTHAGFLVNGTFAIGVQTVILDTGTTDIPVGSQITFSDDLIPRYQVQEATGSPTTSVKLDRPLQDALANNTPVRVSIPNVKTAAAGIKDALISVGLVDRLDTSFDNIDSSDSGNGYNLRLHIRLEDKVQLGNHVAKLLELGDLYITINDAGIIGIKRGLAYSGQELPNKLSENEIISPVDISFDDSDLVIGYDNLYVSGSVVEIATGDVDQSLIDAWKGRNRWQPIKAKSTNIIDFNYLYNNATTADFFGSRRLDYFGVPRLNFKCQLKSFQGNDPEDRIKLQLVRDFALTFKTSENTKLVEVPTTVTQYQFDDNTQRYNSVTFQFTNYPLPNITQLVQFDTPEVIQVQGVNNGFYAIFEFLNNTLHYEVYLEDQATKLLDTTSTFIQQGDGKYIIEVSNGRIFNDLKLYVRFYLSIDGKVKTDKTDFFEFTPTDQATAQWGDSNAWGVLKWGA